MSKISVTIIPKFGLCDGQLQNPIIFMLQDIFWNSKFTLWWIWRLWS